MRAKDLHCITRHKRPHKRDEGKPAKKYRRRFAVTPLSKNRLDKRNQAALSERLGADLRRKGCEVYLNGT